MKKCFTVRHFLQVLKVIASLSTLALIYFGLCRLFGADSLIVEMFADNFLFKAYNIVGLILIILFFCGIWVGRAKAKLLFSIVSGILFLLSVLSYIPNVLTFIEQIIG